MATPMNEQELLELFGMTSWEVDQDADMLEDDTRSDGIVGPVYFGSHIRPETEEEMASMTINKLPKSQLERIIKAARRYHISRSEYVRRKLQDI